MEIPQEFQGQVGSVKIYSVLNTGNYERFGRRFVVINTFDGNGKYISDLSCALNINSEDELIALNRFKKALLKAQSKQSKEGLFTELQVKSTNLTVSLNFYVSGF